MLGFGYDLPPVAEALNRTRVCVNRTWLCAKFGGTPMVVDLPTFLPGLSVGHRLPSGRRSHDHDPHLGDLTLHTNYGAFSKWTPCWIPFFGGCPTKDGLPQERFPLFSQGH